MKASIVGGGKWALTFNSIYNMMGKKMRILEGELIPQGFLTRCYSCPSTYFVDMTVCARDVRHLKEILYWTVS